MTYTIKYTDILAFTKDSKKNHSATIDKIFQKVSTIKSNILLDDFIVIAFDENVKFIDPLFFVLLFDLRHEYKSTLVLDIRYMNDTSQHYVHRLLTQYSDLEQFESYSPHNKSEIYIPIDIIEKDNTEHREQEFKRFLEKEKIHLFTNVAHKKSLINDSQYEYSMLPIMRLRNFDLKDIDTTVHEDTLEPYDKRIKFYNELSLEQLPKKYRENLQNKIEILLEAVGLGTRGLSSSFRDIFFELIDNIRRHTPSQSNAHISFRKDVRSKLYELVIADNSSKGFLNTYKETLEKEKDRLKKSGVKEELLGNYSDVIKDIANEEYEKVLKGLFEIQRTKPNTPNDEIHIHQIPRIAMHFGLPLLVKLLEKLSKESTATKPELKIYLHNNNQYFEIKYSFNNQDGKYKFSVNTRSKHNKDGSYIIITFPEDVKLPAPEHNIGGDGGGHTLTNLSFKNNDYKYFLDNRTKIQEQVNKFEFYEDRHIRDDLDDDKINYKCENKCAIIKYTDSKYTDSSTFSDFLRNIYLYAYKHDVEDIVVVNAPLYEYGEDGARKNHENTEHLKLLVTMLYGKKDSDPYETSLNILFYSDRDLSAILIGGRDQKEYCYLNQLLSSMDESSNQSSICEGISSKPKDLLPSNLFINFDEDKKSILPFELFDILNTDRRNSTAFSQNSDTFSILRDLIEMYLNEVAKRDDVHIDTGSGYHIDRYMEFKKIFEDSRWVRRLAFRLAMQFPKKPEDRKFYLYGTDKYTNMLISLCYTFLDLTFDRFRYKLFNIYDDFDYETLKQKIKTLKAKNTHEIYLISSVVVNARKDIELIDDNADCDIKVIPAIQLNIGNKNPEISPLISIKSNVPPIKITDDKYCHVCKGQRTIPLLEFTNNDPFFVKDTFFDKIPIKQIKSYSNREKKSVKWFDSLNFGHVERGNNHFLYYINTIKFFNQNRDYIKEFLKEDVSKKIDYKEKENIILFTSSHDTNNNFVALVNQEVFNNNAIVLSFNKSRGEANFHDLDSYASFDWENTRVFFVDDSIASSHTVKYFYQMLRSIPSIMNTPNVGLDGMIVMIDRISSYDETILCSYLRDSKDTDKSNDIILKEKLQEIHAFSTFDIKPIKSEVEECFLCSRNTRYLELSKRSALDLTTFQMAKRAYKLEKIEYRAIQPAKEKTLEVRFKNYLKAMATTYIYREFANKEYNEFKDFDLIHKEFSDKMYKDIIFDKDNRFSYYDENVLKEIVKFQSEIALIKACSSPRLSYYYNIRRWIISIVSEKLDVQYIDEEYSFRKIKKFTLKYKLKSYIDTFIKNNRLDKDDEFFLEYYKTMTSFHLFNIYFVTLGYFEDSRILDWYYIELFYQATQSKEIRDFKGDSLLHTYPFAVKFTIANNLEKAIYFEKNLDMVLDYNNIKGNGRIKKYSYLNALKLENTLYWKYHIKKKYNIDISGKSKELKKEQALDKKIEIIKDIFNSIFKDSKVFLFISPYATITPDSYKSYLKNSKDSLINILDSHKNINNYNNTMVDIVQKVFYGAVDVEQNNRQNVHLNEVREKDVVDKISDTWANDYNDTYCVVRLTSIDNAIIENYSNEPIEKNNNSRRNIMKNNPVWFRPIGCIVVEKNAMNYQLHMDISRTILSIKEYIVTYIKKEFSYGVIQEAINKKILKQELQEGYKDMLAKISHSVNEYINIERKINVFLDKYHSAEEYKEYLENMAIYSWGLEQLTSLSQIERGFKYGEEYTENVSALFNESFGDTKFKEQLSGFIKASGLFSDMLCPQCNIEFNVELNNDEFAIPIDANHLKIIIFELIFNALRRIDSTKNTKIEIQINSHSIIISNTLENIEGKEGERIDDKINAINIDGDSSRMGIKTIKKALSLVNYALKANYNEESKMIEINISGGKNGRKN